MLEAGAFSCGIAERLATQLNAQFVQQEEQVSGGACLGASALISKRDHWMEGVNNLGKATAI